MAISVLQETSANSGGSVASLAQAYGANATPGSTLYVAVYGNSAGLTGFTVSDSVNGAWTQIGSTLSNSNSRGAHFKFDNNASNGKPTVTVTPSQSATMQMYLREIGQTSGYDVQASQTQTLPGAGTDAITSGNATPSTQPGLVSGVFLDLDAGSTFTIGTNFVVGVNNAGNLTEQLRYTDTTAKAATATNPSGGSDHFFCWAAFFKEAVAGGAAAQEQQLLLGMGN